MKKLKPKQIGPWCSFCDEKVRAVYSDGSHYRKFACNSHKMKLDSLEDRERCTEADYQTWMNL